MQEIIQPIDKQLLQKELTEDTFVRKTNNGNREIYILDYHTSPNTLREIGRLRELSFRESGGGTGKDCDLDNYDVKDAPFKQLIVWDPEEKEIVGGYRFLEGKYLEKDNNGSLLSPTSKLFKFSETFINNYLPHVIELGRSFVQPDYQPLYNIRKGIYSLDNLWDGLGTLLVDNPDIYYFFGKITMYPRFNITARDLILYFLEKYFPDNEGLMKPYNPVELVTPQDELERVFTGKDYKEDYKLLVKHVRNYGENVPPLVNAYMNLSSTMKTFGTSVNPGFGSVEETGILITISDIYEQKKERHVSQYTGSKKG
ncbi:MAG: GNAT family N-acetyltransferase [Bacteroidales bacterium]|nr:GNAT family N-acetyltransferase [Bacteroidales bacterium]MCF8327206.1 GNAT family N-acetyltransferase [Bacteroidales bacterium]